MYGIGSAPLNYNDLMMRYFGASNPDFVNYFNRLRLQSIFNQLNPGQIAPFMPHLGVGTPGMTQPIGPGPVAGPSFTPPLQPVGPAGPFAGPAFIPPVTPVIGTAVSTSRPNPGTAMTRQTASGGRSVGTQGNRERNAGRSSVNSPFFDYVNRRQA